MYNLKITDNLKYIIFKIMHIVDDVIYLIYFSNIL